MTLQLPENLSNDSAELERARDRAARDGSPVVVSRSRPLAAPEDLLPLLRDSRAPGERSFYWEQPAREHAIAAIGSVWHATASGPQRFLDIAAACARLREEIVVAPGDAAPLLVGAFAFAPDDTMSGDWCGFANARVDLPRLCIVRRGARATLTVNSLVGAESSTPAIRTRGEAEVQQGDPPGPLRYHTSATPAPQTWKETVAAAVADIRAGSLEKVVLARTCSIDCDRPFAAAVVLRDLRRRYPTCSIFSVHDGEADFVGATPETLLALHDGEVRTAALAGTTARAGSPSADHRLARDLKRSDKNGVEHAIVVRAIRDQLAALCEWVEVEPEPRLLTLENVQHLHTPIRGHLRRPCHLLEVAERLHPSPAVGGFPRDIALHDLRAREGFARGLYAGALGWMSLDGDGELDVALRCALLRGRSARLFAGAGIVADSDPAAELYETRMKLQPLLSALMEL